MGEPGRNPGEPRRTKKNPGEPVKQRSSVQKNAGGTMLENASRALRNCGRTIYNWEKQTPQQVTWGAGLKLAYQLELDRCPH